MAVGVTAMQGIVARSPLLAAQPQFAGFNSLGGIDVLALRLWLDTRVMLETPSNVLAGFGDRSYGATLFDLNALQDEYAAEAGSVLELDFYGAGCLLPLSDDALAQQALSTWLPAACPGLGRGGVRPHVVDAAAFRARGAVTSFSPGSAAHMPDVQSVLPGVFFAGDWVRLPPGMAQGLSQEKAYVTGLEAGNAAARRCGLAPVVRVLGVEPDEPHVDAAKSAVRAARALLPRLPGRPLVGW
ncbi:hypothetical protein FOA52_004060 [Chlamydomonas sp. UWO 241]|nr:hypothetical protein FOA52_004060 [Chlamydomonas sp. UWO 241]